VHDDDRIFVAEGVYKGTGNRGVAINGIRLSIISLAGPKKTVIDCENQSRAFYLTYTQNAFHITGFTIKNGYAPKSGGSHLLRKWLFVYRVLYFGK